MLAAWICIPEKSEGLKINFGIIFQCGLNQHLYSQYLSTASVVSPKHAHSLPMSSYKDKHTPSY